MSKNVDTLSSEWRQPLWKAPVIRHFQKDGKSRTGLSNEWIGQAIKHQDVYGKMKPISSPLTRAQWSSRLATGKYKNEIMWALWFDLWEESSEFYKKNIDSYEHWKYFEFLVLESDKYLEDNENYSTYSKSAWDYAEELLRYTAIRDRLLTRKLDSSKRWMDLTRKNGLDSSITYIDKDWRILLLEEFEDPKEAWQKKYELVHYDYNKDHSGTNRIIVKAFNKEDSKSFVDYCKDNWIRVKLKKWSKPLEGQSSQETNIVKRLWVRLKKRFNPWEKPSPEKVNTIERLCVSHSWVLELLLLKVIEKQEWWKEWVMRFIKDNGLEKGVWFGEWYNILVYGDKLQLEFRGVRYDLSNEFLKGLVDERNRLQKIARDKKSQMKESPKKA